MDALKIMTDGMLKEERPNINVGDVVKVHVKIREGERERIQIFEGTIIARKGSGISESVYHRKYRVVFFLRSFSFLIPQVLVLPLLKVFGLPNSLLCFF